MLAGAAAASAAAAPGDLDPSFSGDGRVSLPEAGSFVARALALQPDGAVLVAGASCAPSPDTGDGTCLNSGASSFRLARLTPDGALDPAFGAGGLVTTPVGDGRSQAYAVSVLPGGDVVAAGVARRGGRQVMALARYDAHGALVHGFGAGGIVLQPAGRGFSAIEDLVAEPDGSLLATGQADGRMVVARFRGNGRLDPHWGRHGLAIGGAAYGFGLGLVREPDGSALAVGIAGASADPSDARFGELRLLPDGSPDALFGPAGAARQFVGSSSSYAAAGTATPDGGWAAAGTATVADGRPAMAAVKGGAVGSAPAWTSLVTSGAGAAADDVAALRDGGLLLAGRVTPLGGGLAFADARLLPNGHLDPTWGLAGVSTLSWPGFPVARALAAAVTPDGRLVTAGIGCAGGTGGTSCAGGTAVLLVARQLAAGSPLDTTAPRGRLSGLPRRIHRHRLRRHGLRFRVHASERVRLRVTATGRGRHRRVRVARLSRHRLRRTFHVHLRVHRTAVRRLRRGPIRVTARLADRAGNRSRLHAAVRLR